MFQFGRFASRTRRDRMSPTCGVAPFGNPRIWLVFADPRGLSQLIASFVASESQGIPRALFLTFFSPWPFAPMEMLFVCTALSVSGIKYQVSRLGPGPLHLKLFTFNLLPQKRPICCCMSSFSSISSNMSKNFVPRPPRGPFHIPPMAGGSGGI